MVHSVVENC